MDSVFKKLNFKGQEEIVVINSPSSFEQKCKYNGGIHKSQERNS